MRKTGVLTYLCTYSGSIPTRCQFTGQREEAGLGLYDYSAQWYDPRMRRFLLDWARYHRTQSRAYPALCEEKGDICTVLLKK